MMGYPLGHVDLRNNQGSLALEQRGDGVEFTLTRVVAVHANETFTERVVFKLTDTAVEELIERLMLKPHIPT